MSTTPNLPTEYREFVKEIGDPVTPDQLDIYGKYKKISDKSFRLRTIVQAWNDQQNEDRKMRKAFAIAILIALFLQLLIINAAFFLIGFNIINVPHWVASTFIVSVFTEIISMTMLVLRYLFPKVGTEVMSLIKKL
jgi:hypothetical protein